MMGDEAPREASRALRTLMPDLEAEERDYLPAFRSMADLLLNRATLIAAGVPHRLTEVEFYYRGGRHRDDFTHGDPIQTTFGIWYFHKTGGEYRGGTYKGLDISIGYDDTHGGILIRGLERLAPAPERLDGPCLVVDHLLSLNRSPSIRELVSRFDLRIDAPEEPGARPLYVTMDEGSRGQAVYESPRVGLTLKRGDLALRQRFIARPYRFLTEPARIKKGKVHVIVALHRRGMAAAEIARITGAGAASVRKYAALYEEGKGRSPAEFRGDLSTEDLCRLLGACHPMSFVVPRHLHPPHGGHLASPASAGAARRVGSTELDARAAGNPPLPQGRPRSTSGRGGA